MQIGNLRHRATVLATTLLVGGVLFNAVPTFAENAREKGQAKIDLKGKRAKTSETREVTRQAEIRALENYVSRSQLKLDLYDKCLREDIEEKIEEYLASSTTIREDLRASTRQLSVTVQVEIMDSRLSLALEKCKGATQSRNRIAFVFIARQQGDAGGYGIPTVNTGVESGVEQVFLENKFLVTSSSKMEIDFPRYTRQRLVRQYADSGSVDWSSAEKAAAFMSNDFAVLGTFDIQNATTDSATGMYRVNVIGQGQLVDLASDTKLAATKRMSESALGASVEEAMNTAFNLATERMAKRMVDQINAQGYQ